jgi:PAS domain S-box-containing protein
MSLETDGRRAGAPAKVLVVESDEEAARHLAALLAQLGHHLVGAVDSGGDVVEAVSRARPDLILMDIKLAGAPSGIEVAEELRRRGDAAVVYFIDVADEATLARATRTEPYGYVSKPVQERELRFVIEVALTRRRAARAEIEANAWRAALLRSVGDAVVAADVDGRVTLINRHACALTGWREEEAMGRPLDEVVRIVVTPKGDDAWQAALVKTLIARDGTRRSVDAELTTVRSDDDLAPALGEVWWFRDVSDRALLEDRQRLMARLSEAVASSLDRASIASRAVSVIAGEHAHQCAIHLRGAEGALDVVAASWPPPPWLGDAVKGVADSGAPHVAPEAVIVPLTARGESLGTLSLVVEGGAPALGQLDFQFIEDLGRRVGAAIENAQLYSAARRATRMREDILAIVSHDLRNPLSSILMNADQLLRDPAKNTPDRVARNARTIRGSAERMARLLDDLLDVGRIDEGRLSLNLAPVNASGLVDEALSMFDAAAAQRSIHLVRGAFPDVEVMGDRERILQILSNLIGNALKFSPSGGAIQIRGVSDGRALQVSVSDQGAGISAEQQQHIFDRYWQAPDAPRKGSGLGLYIAKGLVEALGGQIWCEAAPGAGSTFSFTVPLADPGPREKTAPGP